MSLVDGELKFREVRQYFQDHTARQVAELWNLNLILFFFFPSFLATLVACGNSRARDPISATAETPAAAVTVPDP